MTPTQGDSLTRTANPNPKPNPDPNTAPNHNSNPDPGPVPDHRWDGWGNREPLVLGGRTPSLVF